MQGYVTRKGFRGVYYKEYLDNISYAYEHIDEHDYYQEGVHL